MKSAEAPEPPARLSTRERVREWIRTLYRDPNAEERGMEERRQRLLEEINHAVADAPDDMPIKNIIERLNRHHDD